MISANGGLPAHRYTPSDPKMATGVRTATKVEESTTSSRKGVTENWKSSVELRGVLVGTWWVRDMLWEREIP